jgi:catechol 2,3-dioxygenase-like lactoylglutathione lyase family enzyme
MLRLPVSLKGSLRHLTDYAGMHRCPYLARIGMPQAKRSERLAWADVPGFDGNAFVAASLPTVLARMCYGKANLLALPKTRFYRWIQGKLPDVYLKCFTALLRHLSRYVLEPRIVSDNWNGDLVQEAYRFLEKELGLPVHQKTLFDGYYDTQSYFCDYVTLLLQKDELTTVASENGLTVSAAALGDCFRKHVGMFDFERIHEMLITTMLLKEYDPARHVFVLDPQPFQASAKRLDRCYGHAIRR